MREIPKIESGKNVGVAHAAAIRLTIDVDDMIASNGSLAPGDENNRHEPDGIYSLGDGTVDGYAIMNLVARYGRDQLPGDLPGPWIASSRLAQPAPAF